MPCMVYVWVTQSVSSSLLLSSIIIITATEKSRYYYKHRKTAHVTTGDGDALFALCTFLPLLKDFTHNSYYIKFTP